VCRIGGAQANGQLSRFFGGLGAALSLRFSTRPHTPSGARSCVNPVVESRKTAMEFWLQLQEGHYSTSGTADFLRATRKLDFWLCTLFTVAF